MVDKLNDVRQVKVATVQAAASIVAENLSQFTSTAGMNSSQRIAEIANVTKKLALELEKHIWSSGQVGGGR